MVEVATLAQAIDLLRREHFNGVLADAADFLPLERAAVSQQAGLILNTIGEGVCIVDGEGRCSWMNNTMRKCPPKVRDSIRKTCQDAFNLFSKQPAPAPDSPARSKKYSFNIDDQQFMELIASPVIDPSGRVAQIVAVVWDATGNRRLQQTLDAIDKAGRELVKLESDSIVKLPLDQRLKVLEEKIVNSAKGLMHFDHFAIRSLDRKTNKLELVMSTGLPPDALEVELFAQPEGNGISGYVAHTGRSYICADVERDPRYVHGLDSCKSSLTVPLWLDDRVIGIFNIESEKRAAFTEDDRQFADIFGRYVAIGLNMLDLMVGERMNTCHKVADDVSAEVAGPLNDILLDATTLMDDYIGNDLLRGRLKQIIENAGTIRAALRQAAYGQNKKIIGAAAVVGGQDAVITGARILVADDEPNIRDTVRDVLRKYHAQVTVAECGCEAIALLEANDYDLVVSDIRMPDKSGYDVFAAARRHALNVPVILMTGFGYDPAHNIVRASQEGLSAVLFKPFKVELLLTEVRKALQASMAPVGK